MTVSTFEPNEVEGFTNPTSYEGISVGDVIKLTKAVSDDLPAGATGVVTALDSHRGFPVTATMVKPILVESLPLALDEIAVVPA